MKKYINVCRSWLSQNSDWISAIGTIAQAITGAVALYLAGQAFFIDTSDPQLQISPPRVLRIEFSTKYINVFTQPTFIVSNPTKKTVIIKNMCMLIQPVKDIKEAVSTNQNFDRSCQADDSQSIMFLEWTHNAKFKWDNERDISVLEEEATDAVPFQVSISNPQTPMAAFWIDPKNGENFQAEICYRATIYLSSSLGDRVLQTSVDFKLTDKNVEGLKKFPKQKPFWGQHISLYAWPIGENCGVNQ